MGTVRTARRPRLTSTEPANARSTQHAVPPRVRSSARGTGHPLPGSAAARCENNHCGPCACCLALVFSPETPN